jgi:hypothetical protein
MREIEHTYQEHSRKKGRGQEISGDRKEKQKKKQFFGEKKERGDEKRICWKQKKE